MQYVLMIYADESQAPGQEAINQMVKAFGAYTEALKKAGVLAGGERLYPTSSATSVRMHDGKVKVLNGPYAESKEQLGGYYIIDVPDLDAAISWAGRCPGAAYGTIEVRPIMPMMADA